MEEKSVEFKGYNGQLVLHKEYLEIKREGFAAFALHGLKGTKSIPYKNITAIQFKKAGLTAGYIQLSLMGSMDSKAGYHDALRDENSITFLAKQNDNAEIVRDFIQRKINNRQ